VTLIVDVISSESTYTKYVLLPAVLRSTHTDFILLEPFYNSSHSINVHIVYTPDTGYRYSPQMQ
jgi:hypothetical protein